MESLTNQLAGCHTTTSMLPYKKCLLHMKTVQGSLENTVHHCSTLTKYFSPKRSFLNPSLTDGGTDCF